MRAPPFDPFALLRLQMQTARMMAEAAAVIWMRSLGMWGIWNTTPGEATRMVAEKPAAFAHAAQAAMVAAAMGRSPEKTFAAALRPVARNTRSNARRLTRRGPAKR